MDQPADASTYIFGRARPVRPTFQPRQATGGMHRSLPRRSKRSETKNLMPKLYSEGNCPLHQHDVFESGAGIDPFLEVNSTNGDAVHAAVPSTNDHDGDC